MKKIVSAFFALVLCLLCVPSARAADNSGWDTYRIQWSMAMTAHLTGNALDAAGKGQSKGENQYLTAFSQIPYLTPDRAMVLEYAKDQAEAAQKALGVEKELWSAVAPALAKAINGQNSRDYARAAERTKAEGDRCVEWSGCYSLVLLMYGEEISLSALNGIGLINSRAAFVISTREINERFSEADVAAYVRQLGIDMPLVRVYERADLDRMLAERPWTGSTGFTLLANALVASDKRKEVMLSPWLDPDAPNITDSMRYNMVIPLLRSMTTVDQALLKTVAEQWLPLCPADTKDPVEDFLNATNNLAYDRHVAPPTVKYGTELHETKLKADGTYLVVFERTVPGEKAQSWYDLFLEAVLPPVNIPETVGAADYIIRCSVTYEGGKDKGNIHLHYPLTHITVHDAHTGEMLRDLGSVKRTLSGTVTLPAGDTWWDPLYTHVWSKIRALFMTKV